MAKKHGNKWVVEGVIPKGAFAILPPVKGVDDFPNVLDMALRVISGLPVEGHRTTQGPVLWAQLNHSCVPVTRREIAIWCLERQWMGVNLKHTIENFHQLPHPTSNLEVVAEKAKQLGAILLVLDGTLPAPTAKDFAAMTELLPDAAILVGLNTGTGPSVVKWS